MSRMPAGVLLGALAVLRPAAPAAAQETFTVVVHAANPVSTMTPVEVGYAFLGRIDTWGDGTAIEPVDLPEKDPTRAEFSRVIHGRSVDAIQAYWRQRVFTGKGLAPPVRSSPDDVIAFVASNPRAVGYVPAGTALPPLVKAVTIADADQAAVYDAVATEPPTRLTSPPLHYPALLRRDGIEGSVLLDLVVLPDGRVGHNDIVVVESTDARFNEAAISVIRGSRFRPGRLNGKAVAVRIRQRVDFTIAR